MSEQVWSVTHKKFSDFHGKIRFQSRFTIRWELGDKNFLKIDIICLDDSLKYWIMVIKQMKTSYLSPTAWLSESLEGRTWGPFLESPNN